MVAQKKQYLLVVHPLESQKQLQAYFFFANGIVDVIDEYFQYVDREMMKKLESMDVEKLKIREKIIESVKARIEIIQPNKKSISKIIAFFSIPWNNGSGIGFLWRTCDLIWSQVAGDTSTDYNYYTKRTLLGGVYSSTLLFWLKDESEGAKETEKFLRNRVEDIIKIAGFLRGK